jgi:hypothetical protein
LQTEQDKEKVEVGVDKLKMVIREAYARSHGWAPVVLRIAASSASVLLMLFSFWSVCVVYGY